MEYELWISGHGSGITCSEKPITLEQNHEGDGSELREKVTFERQIVENGDSTIPEKFPATLIFAPITFLKVMSPTIGSALVSYLSSGWKPEYPVMLIPKLIFSNSASEMKMPLI